MSTTGGKSTVELALSVLSPVHLGVVVPVQQTAQPSLSPEWVRRCYHCHKVWDTCKEANLCEYEHEGLNKNGKEKPAHQCR